MVPVNGTWHGSDGSGYVDATVGFTLRLWNAHGFLIGWESLLSTYGKEEGMLGDLYGAILSLHTDGFGFVRREARRRRRPARRRAVVGLIE